MAQATPVVQNKKLLLVALGLGAVMAIIYNVHISQVRASLEGKSITLIRYTRDIKAGEKVVANSRELVTIPKSAAAGLGNVIIAEGGEDGRRHDLINETLNQPVKAGQWAVWTHVTGKGGPNRRADDIEKGMVEHPLEVRPENAPGQILMPGDYVNVVGIFTTDKGRQTLSIIEGVRVTSVEGRAQAESSSPIRTAANSGSTTVRRLGLEVSSETAKKLINVMSQISPAEIWVHVRNPDDRFPDRPPGAQISKEVEKMAEKPK